MMARTLGPPPGSLVSELTRLAEPHRDRLLVAALIALAAHAGLGLFAASREPRPEPVRPPVDVELAFREPPPPPEPKEPEPPQAPEAPKAAEPKPIAKLAPPPPAARAGAVLTAPPDPAPAPAAAEPFDFTSDPNSHVYGSGVVAVGGTATHGLAGARVGGTGKAPVRTPPPGDGLTAAADLSQKPRLRVSDPCRGFFPEAAQDDVAVVSVRVVIGKSGQVSKANVVSESPTGQGFGAAARRCMLDQVFVPALDRDGNAAATALNVNVKFSR
jgi:outer membrane biosynthesis protein TonB